jgi:hypothetical protein
MQSSPSRELTEIGVMECWSPGVLAEAREAEEIRRRIRARANDPPSPRLPASRSFDATGRRGRRTKKDEVSRHGGAIEQLGASGFTGMMKWR